VGVAPAPGRALALNASDRGSFPVEFSLASIFPFGSGNLRSGSAANDAAISDPGYNGACSHCVDGHRDVHSAYNWQLCFPSDMDFTRTRGDLVAVNVLVA